MDQAIVMESSHEKPRPTETEDVVKAQNANAFEHDLTLAEALKFYRTGVVWSIIMSTAVIMEGYDTKLMATLFAEPAFLKTFGTRIDGHGKYQISAPWQAGLNNGSIVGQLAGLLIAGYFCERYGFRASMIWSLLLLIACVFIPFFAHSLTVLLIGQILIGLVPIILSCKLMLTPHGSGVPLGFFQTTTVIYALEITPTCLRAHLTNYVNFCWVCCPKFYLV